MHSRKREEGQLADGERGGGGEGRRPRQAGNDSGYYTRFCLTPSLPKREGMTVTAPEEESLPSAAAELFVAHSAPRSFP